MRKFVLLVLSLILFLGCKRNKIERPEKPEDLIAEAKMVEVLYDMTLLSAAKGINKKVLENQGIFPQEYIFQKHNIDSAQFARSNAYYSFDIKDYQRIYDKVKSKLEEDKERFNVLLDEKIRERDSISELNRKRRDSIIKARTEEATDGLQ